MTAASASLDPTATLERGRVHHLVFNHSRFRFLLPVAFHVAFNAMNVAWLPVTSAILPFVLLIAAERCWLRSSPDISASRRPGRR